MMLGFKKFSDYKSVPGIQGDIIHSLNQYKQKKLFKKLIIYRHLVSTDEKSRIRIRESVVRICGIGSGSVPKCHGSTILVLTVKIKRTDFSSMFSKSTLAYIWFRLNWTQGLGIQN
jgi:hypothetical protein